MADNKTNLTPELAKRILVETKKRSERLIRLTPEDALFKPQVDFIRDPSQMKVACCTRRAGKSYALAFSLAWEALRHPESLCLYVNKTREAFRTTMWPAFSKLNAQFNLGMQFKANTFDIVLPNKATIIGRGATSRKDIDNLRGPSYPIAVIDEAQNFGNELHYLIDEAIRPGTLDYEGWMAVTGTPNAAAAGPFYDMCHNERLGYSVHHWTVLQNESMPHAREWVESERKRRGWSENSPAYRREYKGEWVRDSTNLIFNGFKDTRNLCMEFDKDATNDWGYVLGVDPGYNDAMGFVVVAYSQKLGKVVVVESYKEEGLSPSKGSVVIKRYMQEYPLQSIVVDTGGAGIGYEKHWQEEGIPALPADKRQKVANLIHMNSDLSTGRLQLVRNTNLELLDEMNLLIWDDKAMIRGELKKDERFQDHLCDALQYAWRECKHRFSSWEVEGPKKGTKEWWDAEEERLFQNQISQLRGGSGKPWWQEK